MRQIILKLGLTNEQLKLVNVLRRTLNFSIYTMNMTHFWLLQSLPTHGLPIRPSCGTCMQYVLETKWLNDE